VSALPRHTRPVPLEWPELLATAQERFPATFPPDGHARFFPTWRMLRQVNQLPHDRLETNYYFALGEVMTVMAGRLRHKAVRHRLIMNVARSMIKGALLQRADTVPLDVPFVPLIGDLRSDTLAEPFVPVAMTSLQMLPFAEQMLSRTLAVVTVDRRREPRPKWWRSVRRERQLVNVARYKETTIGPLAVNAPVGASSVLGTFLIAETGETIAWNDETMARPIDSAVVERVRRSSVFLAAASLRMDEFHRGDGWEFTEDGTGIWFNRGILAAPPPPLDMEYINNRLRNFHEDRLICPAVQADRLALDIARNILPDALVVASQLVPAQEFPTAVTAVMAG
jgi:hypothetical protein